MKRSEVYKLATKLLMAWLLLSAAAMLCGRYAIQPLIPFLNVVTYGVKPDYVPFIESHPDGDTDKLTITAFVNKPLYIHDHLTVEPGAKLSVAVDVLHVLVPIVILFSFLLVWPVGRLHERLLLLGMGIPMTFIVLGLTVPFLLLGKLELMLVDYAAQGGVERSPGLIGYWMLICESGGAWLIPLVATVFSALSVHALLARVGPIAKRRQLLKRMRGKRREIPNLR